MTPPTVIPYDTRVPRALDAYALAHFVGVVPMTVALLAAAGEEGPWRVEVIIGAVLALWVLLNLGGRFEHRRLAPYRHPAAARDSWGWRPGCPRPPALGAMAGLATAVAMSWLCLVAYSREFDGAPNRGAA